MSLLLLSDARRRKLLASDQYLYVGISGVMNKIKISPIGAIARIACEITNLVSIYDIKISENKRYLVRTVVNSPYIQVYENSNFNVPGAEPNFVLISGSSSLVVGTNPGFGMTGLCISPDSQYFAYIYSNGSISKGLVVYKFSDLSQVYNDVTATVTTANALEFLDSSNLYLNSNIGASTPSGFILYNLPSSTKTYLGIRTNYPVNSNMGLAIDVLNKFAFCCANVSSPSSDITFFNIQSGTYVSSTRIGGSSTIQAIKYDSTLKKLFIQKLNNTLDVYDVTYTTSPNLTLSNTVNTNFNLNSSQKNIGVFDAQKRFLICPDSTANRIKILDRNADFADIATATDVNRPTVISLKIAIC